jgi:uncharacterized membrane protein
MRIHPVHMMVVHFPAALLPMDYIFQFAAIYFNDPRLNEAAYFCLLAGVLSGWIAVLTGLYDFLTRVLKPGEAAPKAAFVHAGLQSILIMGFTIILSVEYHHISYIQDAPVWMLATKGFLILVMLVGNYFGGELVLRHIAKEM